MVRRPDGAAAFNGTVVVEWLNVSGGLDAAADYTYLADELIDAASVSPTTATRCSTRPTRTASPADRTGLTGVTHHWGG